MTRLRLALRSTLVVLVAYLVIFGGLALWLQHQLQSLTGEIMANSAQLLGREIAVTLAGSLRGPALPVDRATRARLKRVVDNVTHHSDVVRSIAVVDATGHVIASDEPTEVGHVVETAEQVFGHDGVARVFRPGKPFSHGGEYTLFVPVAQGNQPLAGYVKMALASHRIAGLYWGAQRQLLLAMFTGMGCIAVLAFLLQRQLSRRSRAVARALEGAIRGEMVPPPTDAADFSHAFEAAGKLGRELNDMREKSLQARRSLDAVAEAMNVGLVLLGPSRDQPLANGRAMQLFGCHDNAEFEEVWKPLRARVDSILDQTPDATTKGRHLDLDVPAAGGALPMRLDFHPLDGDNKTGYLVLVRNRGAIESLETDLRLATQLRVLARLYMAAAHELRAPLHAMTMNLELLGEILKTSNGVPPDTQERQQRYVRVLREELARLSRSLQALLSQTVESRDTRETFDLCQLLRDVGVLLAPQAKRQRVRLDVTVPNTAINVTGYRDHLRQAVLNIAINALEAMPDGGQMEIRLEAHAGQARLSIHDSGPGVPPELLDKIGEMHFTTKDSGTGVGLYVARSVVESYGGLLSLDSGPGTGTCFHVTIPLTSNSI